MVDVNGLRLTAHSKLDREFAKRDVAHALLVGTQSWFALAALLSDQQSEVVRSRPNLAVVSLDEDLLKLQEALEFFDPTLQVHILPGFDMDLYSGLYPSAQIIGERMGWLNAAQTARPGQIFLASASSIMQKTLPFKILANHRIFLKKNQTLPNDFSLHLSKLGYRSVPLVEDLGTFSIRGGIIDVFSPAHRYPVRIELFADDVDSLRYFDPDTQRSLEETPTLTIIPPREAIFSDENVQAVAQGFAASVVGRDVDPHEIKDLQRSILQQQYFHGVDFLLPYFYSNLQSPTDHFSEPVNVWLLDSIEVQHQSDSLLGSLKSEFNKPHSIPICVDYQKIFAPFDSIDMPIDSRKISLMKIHIQDGPTQDADLSLIDFRTAGMDEFRKACLGFSHNSSALAEFVGEKIRGWKQESQTVFVTSHTLNQCQRLKHLLETAGFEPEILKDDEHLWQEWQQQQLQQEKLIHIIPRGVAASQRFIEDHLIFLRDDDFFGHKSHRRQYKSQGTLTQRTHALSFGDLKVGDLIVHKLHGVGIYEGLTVMPINGVDAEFIHLSYKDNDKLYLPVYRVGQIQKYSGPGSARLVDKLGGTGWAKAKTKVKAKLRDMAAELLDFYAKRAQVKRPSFSVPDEDYLMFENQFPYEETEDQLKVIDDILGDMTQDTPMDRLVCGDVGFGKTEIAMRAAFKAVQDGRQVAVIAPTTILTFQHLETFKRRFRGWPVTIEALNRFVDRVDIKKTIDNMKLGKVDIVIGTHRLLSKDIGFKDLGLLIIDEEQKFGVKHKERIRQIKTEVDTLALSATPIPRTLNLSLVGIRDLSIINTPPVDRLPTRTFVTKFDKETIKRAVESELDRGGQVFFLHNKVQSIDAIASELREILPSVRMAIAHGQMNEGQLEKTMIKFFNHDLDILVCTTIIESGMDIPRANTMFINDAQQFGLSQLYQLRGRVGRSKDRAYCYLLVPPQKRLDPVAQERLKIIQENTALGSGIRVAQYDLELRGAGDILGGQQSGHINAVGYELYLELLEEAVQEKKGLAPTVDTVEPEINLPIAALIPDGYIPDIRIRLSYYKALAEINDDHDVDGIEDELRDQFGKPPESVINLFGVMLIRKMCRDLGIKDLSAGRNSIALSFTEATPLPTDEVVRLASRENKKYSIAPDSRFKIRMNEITWPRVLEELQYLTKLC